MKLKNIIVFALAVAVCLAAAHYKFYDSSHSMGLVTDKGGKVLHPVVLDGGRNFYSVVVTATVIPPYQGDARIVLEGNPHMTYSIYNSGPIVDLGVHRHPSFKNDTFYGLQGKDSIALWMVMKPDKPNSRTLSEKGNKVETDDPIYPSSCCSSYPETKPSGEKDRATGEDLALCFYDTTTNQPVMRIPVIFRTKGEESHANKAH
jgi:hypothetical protein